MGSLKPASFMEYRVLEVHHACRGVCQSSAPVYGPCGVCPSIQWGTAGLCPPLDDCGRQHCEPVETGLGVSTCFHFWGAHLGRHSWVTGQLCTQLCSILTFFSPSAPVSRSLQVSLLRLGPLEGHSLGCPLDCFQRFRPVPQDAGGAVPKEEPSPS